MPPNADDFRTELKQLLSKAEEMDFVAVDVNSGNLHRRVGGYPGQDHRMPICCQVMYAEMHNNDEIITQPDSGKGASVIVRYQIPRR
jgi:hypothetical protein